jgi:hypothetical protein
MNDEPAIALFVKDGGKRHEWKAVDESVRLHYRLLAVYTGRLTASSSAPPG